MINLYFLGVIAIIAYLSQIILGLRQIKNFNQVYARMRKAGKVAIGRRPGRLTSGTLLLCAVNQLGEITEAEMMQGVSVLARFKAKPAFVGLNIHSLSVTSPELAKENRFTKKAILNAKEVYLQVEQGTYQETKPVSPIMGVGLQLKLWKQTLTSKFTKRSV